MQVCVAIAEVFGSEAFGTEPFCIGLFGIGLFGIYPKAMIARREPSAKAGRFL
tara:strand:- start:135 stop:293 length:159 start_codon:yes stop_codon:yes gene_type:complete